MAVLRAESGDGRWTKASHERWTNTNGRVAVRGMYNVRVTTAGFAARKAAEEAERRKPKPPPAF
jgi:hypothetical protein